MSLTPITINASGILQPSALREYKIFQRSENESLDGAMQRNIVSTPSNPNGYKFVAELVWDDVSATDFIILDRVFSTTGSGVVYNNPSSKYGNLLFSGLPFTDDSSDYAAGESLLTTFKCRIRQF